MVLALNAQTACRLRSAGRRSLRRQVALRGDRHVIPLLPDLQPPAYSARVIGNPVVPKKIRSGGSAASTTFRIAAAVACGSPGLNDPRSAAMFARAGA